MADPKEKRQAGAAFMKPVQPDEKLAAVIGGEPIPRTEVTRKLWDYIRSHNLQDPENKTFINADEQLKQVFGGKDKVSMFEMTKLVFGHVKS
jgi:upstream activation factor subunit UAF30